MSRTPGILCNCGGERVLHQDCLHARNSESCAPEAEPRTVIGGLLRLVCSGTENEISGVV